ncbi:D-serine ammonia-lyase [Henriciella aquimarina]|uniref:D-serine ammonia-lyase n=1 Tax=Henriciella aquimarina TaxID=545261 RepID=UPI000A05B746|nr:D-serine ammonia-lyase [Henriciella aquimarina]
MQLIPSRPAGEVMRALSAGQPCVFANPLKVPDALANSRLSLADIEAAEGRLRRFAPLLQAVFPELEETGGIIESPLLPGDALASYVGLQLEQLWIKADSALPVAGSVKARGGVYEVLAFAEKIAREAGLLTEGDYRSLGSREARDCFSGHTVVVGSTGNLGFSIGLTARALGLGAEVHMSSEAKAWKKARLRKVGATVVEHEGDYRSAVAEARRIAEADPKRYFVDDEHSETLFIGYATAALRLKEQFAQAGIVPTEEAPVVVFLPCGVGGAPGGITFGLKAVFGEAVKTVLVQPVEAPCFLLRALRPDEPDITVYDIGRTNRTVADGMAVPCVSDLVFQLVGKAVDGFVSVSDPAMLDWVNRTWRDMELRLEPSGAAGFAALERVLPEMERPARARFVVWTTGGAMLPDDEFEPLLTTSLSSAGTGGAR